MKLSLLAIALTFAVTAGAQEVQIKKVPPGYTKANSGVQMFHSYCASCHGVDGTGNGPAAVALKVAPPDLTTMKAQNDGKFPEVNVMGILRGNVELAAHGSRDMPLWGPIFHSMDGQGNAVMELRIHNLAEYLKSIQK